MAETLTQQEAADRLRVSVRTVLEMRKRGSLRFVKIGQRVRIPAAEVRKIETARKNGAIY